MLSFRNETMKRVCSGLMAFLLAVGTLMGNTLPVQAANPEKKVRWDADYSEVTVRMDGQEVWQAAFKALNQGEEIDESLAEAIAGVNDKNGGAFVKGDAPLYEVEVPAAIRAGLGEYADLRMFVAPTEEGMKGTDSELVSEKAGKASVSGLLGTDEKKEDSDAEKATASDVTEDTTAFGKRETAPLMVRESAMFWEDGEFGTTRRSYGDKRMYEVTGKETLYFMVGNRMNQDMRITLSVGETTVLKRKVILKPNEETVEKAQAEGTVASASDIPLKVLASPSVLAQNAAAEDAEAAVELSGVTVGKLFAANLGGMYARYETETENGTRAVVYTLKKAQFRAKEDDILTRVSGFFNDLKLKVRTVPEGDADYDRAKKALDDYGIQYDGFAVYDFSFVKGKHAYEPAEKGQIVNVMIKTLAAPEDSSLEEMGLQHLVDKGDDGLKVETVAGKSGFAEPEDTAKENDSADIKSEDETDGEEPEKKPFTMELENGETALVNDVKDATSRQLKHYNVPEAEETEVEVIREAETGDGTVEGEADTTVVNFAVDEFSLFTLTWKRDPDAVLNENIVTYLESDNNGEPAPTGKPQNVTFFAYNDNPNATAIAKIRVYADQSETRSTDTKEVRPVSTRDLEVRGRIGAKATTITAKWNKTEGADPMNYVEFELPAGASVSLELPFIVDTGYDSNVKARIYSEYMVANKAGEYPEEWTPAESEAKLTWTGEFGWEKFRKQASTEKIAYSELIDGYFDPNAVTYTFSVSNKKPGAKTGVIYTSSMVLEDTVTLPKNLTVPEGAKVENGKLVDKDDNVIYEIVTDPKVVTIDSVSIEKQTNKISFKITVNNANEKDTKFNPLQDIKAVLHMDHLLNLTPASTSELVREDDAFGKLQNSASLIVTSVECDKDGKQEYKDISDAEVGFEKADALSLEKAITGVKNGKNETVAPPSNSQWKAGKGYTVSYQLTVKNISTSTMFVRDLTDVLPKGLVLQTDSVVVKVNGNAIKVGTKVTTGEDGSTRIVWDAFSVPAAKNATVNYDVKVTDNEEIYKTLVNQELVNTASLNGNDVTSKVLITGIPNIILKKAVKARFTRDINGNQHVIVGTYDWKKEEYSSIQIRGDYYRLGYSSDPDMATKEKLLKEFNAGDFVLYEICVENTGDGAYTGIISDRDPFSLLDEKIYYYGITHYYYATGQNSYQSNVSYEGGALVSGKLKKAVGSAGNTEPGTSYENFGKTGLNDRATSSEYSSLVGGSMGGVQWKFDGIGENDKINPGEELHQTTLIQIPGTGDKEITRKKQYSGPDIRDNYNFENLATKYAYSYTSQDWEKNDTLGNAVYATNPNGGENLKSNDIFHTVKGQISIDTGVIAKGFLPEKSDLLGTFFRTYYKGRIGDGDGWKNEPTTDLTYFEARNDQLILNYVYVYNDSSEPLKFDDKELNIFYPKEFACWGFAHAIEMDTPDSKGYYFHMHGDPSSDFVKYTEENGRDQYKAAGKHQLAAFNYRSYSPELYNKDDEPGTSALDKDYDPLHVNTNKLSTASTKHVDYPDKDYRRVNVALDYNNVEIAPYTGLLFYYVLKVNNADKAQERFAKNDACFYAEVVNKPKNNYNVAYISNYSPIIEMKEVYESRFKNREGLTNTGISRSYWHTSETSSSGVLNIGLKKLLETNEGLSTTNASASKVVAGVSMKLGKNHYYKVAVDKEVVKNDGEDSVDQYRDGNVYTPNLNENYHKSYEWGYPLHDGIHRTVDGTVTWKVQIANTGNTATYDAVDYSMMLDTIDSPYELAEIYVPKFIYNTENLNNEREFENFRAKLPIGLDGWKNISPGVDVLAFDVSGKMLDSTESTGSGIDSSTPRIRVTRRLIKGGSIASGYDVSSGDYNVDAYRYVIELAGLEKFENWRYYYRYPLLKNGETFEMYLTYATTDAIETNYNSFSLVMPQVAETDSVTVSNEAKQTTVGETHNGMGSVASEKAMLRSVGALKATTSGPYYPTGNGSTYAQEPASAIAVEHSDWTDTSYTDGMKTLTHTDKNGNKTTIDTRSDGSMVLPKTVAPGDALHIKLMVESVLHQSENYTYFDDLVIYDLYGTSDKFDSSEQRNLVGYDVDFSTIKLSDSLGREYILGQDYDLFYTNTNLVHTEHHPIQPVNTLTYAADYNLMLSDTVNWTPYKEGDKVTIDDAHAFKIELRGDKKTVYNSKTTDAGIQWAGFKMYVDYDAKVAEGADTTEFTYPNIEAYTAKMHVKDSTEIKPFKEDTTATLFKATSDAKILIRKSTVNLDDTEAEDKDSEFKFVLFRCKPRQIYYQNSSTVNAAIAFTLKSGEYKDLLLKGNAELIYTIKDGDGEPLVKDIAGDFFNTSDSQYYYLMEVDSGKYLLKDMMVNSSSNMNSDDPSTYAFRWNGLETTDESVNEWISKTSGVSIPYVRFDKKTPSADGNFRIDITATNVYGTPDLQIIKQDMDGNTIFRPVTFQIKDAEGNLVTFEDIEGVLHYSEEGTITDITFTGATTLYGMMPGKYTVEETMSPTGYKAQGVSEITLKAPTSQETKVHKLIVKNPSTGGEVDGGFLVSKVDADTKEVITEDTAVFQLYDSKEEGAKPLNFAKKTVDGKTYYEYATEGEVFNDLTTAKGLLDVRGLRTGTYYLVETKAPEGYDLAGDTLETATQINITRTTARTEVAVPNAKISATLNIHKVDAVSQQPITGSSAEFSIYTSENEDAEPLHFKNNGRSNYSYDVSGGITKLVTRYQDGSLNVNGLPKGTYFIREISAPGGYAVSSETFKVEVTSSGEQEVTVKDTAAKIKLRIGKTWRLEGSYNAYPLRDVPFTLYQVNEAQTEAVPVGEGTTDANGILEIPDVDWTKPLLLYEEVPKGYMPEGQLTSYFRNDETGVIDLSVKEAKAGYSEIQLLAIDFSDEFRWQNTDGIWTYFFYVENVKNVVYGGLYSSVSYKTIDNKKLAEKYGIPARTGYGFYYLQEDYDNGNYNYVEAVNPGDVVSYTLNVTNVSDYPFRDLVLIDRLPEVSDTGVVNTDEKRDSEFAVTRPDPEITVSVDGDILTEDDFRIEYSDSVKFTNKDFDGLTEWSGSYDTAKSFRIAFVEGFQLMPGSTVVVSYDGKISDTAKPGQFAWNDFAYRYRPVGEDRPEVVKLMAAPADAQETGETEGVVDTGAVLTPEPPKVGVRIAEGFVDISGRKHFKADPAQNKAQTFTFKLVRTDKSDYAVYYDKDGTHEELPAAGLTVTAEVAPSMDAADAAEFIFPKLYFTHTGRYEFDMTEVIPAGAVDGVKDGIRYSEKKYHIVVNGDAVADYMNAEGIPFTVTENGTAVDEVLFVNEGTTEQTVTKVWDDGGNKDKKRPTSITVRLLANGTEVQTAEVTEAEGWKHTFTGLDAYDADGKKIAYTVTEDVPAGYTVAYDGMTITNKYTPERKTVDIPVGKVWSDSDNADGKRPASVTVILKADGSEVRRLTLTEAGGWKGIFEGLAAAADGKAITYTVEEVVPSGYVAVISGDASTGFTVTNNHTPETPPETPPETTTPETTPETTPPGGSIRRGGGGGGGGGGRRPRPDTPTTPEEGVLGAVRDNVQDVLGAIRNPQQVLGAVRTGDTSAMFICGEIFALAVIFLAFWAAFFKKLRGSAKK